MKSRTTKGFWSHFNGLSAEVRNQAARTFRLWRENPTHPSLYFKRVHATEPVYAVRVSRNYRALGLRKGDTMTWFWIGSHADYDKLLG